MTNEPTNPKVVAGEEVTFEGGTSQPDTLDGVVQAAGTSNGSFTENWELENMDFLAERLVGVLSVQLTSAAKSVLPYVIAAKKVMDQTCLAIAPEVGADLLHPFLEREYGTELAQTGIYEAVGLHKPGSNVSLEDLWPYFPEFEKLTKLDGRVISLQENPYQALIAFPAEVRPFFTGVIRLANYLDTANPVTCWYIPITLKDVMAYAKEIGQLGKTKEYMDILIQVKGQNQQT